VRRHRERTRRKNGEVSEDKQSSDSPSGALRWEEGGDSANLR